MRVLVTRPAPDNERTAQRLRELGHEPILLPLLEMHVTNEALPQEPIAAIAVTSANALRALAWRNDLPTLVHLPLFAVGDRTAQAARAAGFETVKSAGGDLDDLATLIRQADIEGAVLHPAGRHRAGDLASRIGGNGPRVVTIEVYEMQPVPDPPLSSIYPLPDKALFYSRRTAETFCRLEVHFDGPMLCLSGNVAEPLHAAGYDRILIAAGPNEAALFELLA